MTKIKKGYYTDGHERDDVVKYRNERFTIKYFTAEHRTYRWVHLDDTFTVELDRNYPTFPKNCSHQYTCLHSSINKREYHVDSHNSLATYIQEDDKKLMVA